MDTFWKDTLTDDDHQRKLQQYRTRYSTLTINTSNTAYTQILKSNYALNYISGHICTHVYTSYMP